MNISRVYYKNSNYSQKFCHPAFDGYYHLYFLAELMREGMRAWTSKAWMAREYVDMSRPMGELLPVFISCLTKDFTYPDSEISNEGISWNANTYPRFLQYLGLDEGDSVETGVSYLLSIRKTGFEPIIESIIGPLPSHRNRDIKAFISVGRNMLSSRKSKDYSFLIPKKKKGDYRLITAPNKEVRAQLRDFNEKVVNPALLEEFGNNGFKGILAYVPGVDYVKKLVEEPITQQFCLSLDIKNWYHQVNGERLIESIHNMIKAIADKKTTEIADKFCYKPSMGWKERTGALVDFLQEFYNEVNAIPDVNVATSYELGGYERGGQLLHAVKSLKFYIKTMLKCCIKLAETGKPTDTESYGVLLDSFLKIRYVLVLPYIAWKMAREYNLLTEQGAHNRSVGSMQDLFFSQIKNMVSSRMPVSLPNLAKSCSYRIKCYPLQKTIGFYTIPKDVINKDPDVDYISSNEGCFYRSFQHEEDYNKAVSVLEKEVGVLDHGAANTFSYINTDYAGAQRFISKVGLNRKKASVMDDLHTCLHETVPGEKDYCVALPQGYPTSGGIANFCISGIVSKLYSVLDHCPEVENSRVLAYSDNVFIFYDVKKDLPFIHNTLQKRVSYAFRSEGIRLNEAKEHRMSGVKRILGLVVDDKGVVKCSRKYLDRVNEILIALEKKESIVYRGEPISRRDMGKLIGMANWVHHSSEQANGYNRKLVNVKWIPEKYRHHFYRNQEQTGDTHAGKN